MDIDMSFLYIFLIKTFCRNFAFFAYESIYHWKGNYIVLNLVSIVRLLSQEHGNISNNITNNFLKVSYQEILNSGNGLIFFLLLSTHLILPILFTE